MIRQDRKYELGLSKEKKLVETLVNGDFILVPYLLHGRGSYILARSSPLKNNWLGSRGQFERIIGKTYRGKVEVFGDERICYGFYKPYRDELASLCRDQLR